MFSSEDQPTVGPPRPAAKPTPPMEDDETVSIRPGNIASGLTESSSGRYQLLQRIGSGGMGEVFEAQQVEPIRRRVALKLIKRGMDTEAVVARFESERQALALMDHECIAKVFDAGMTADGRPFFAMEYVKGIPVTDYCDQNQLGIRKRLELFLQITEGVQHAHQKGIIHRDLKPSNVLITVHENRAVPKIIDFGLAKATAQSLTDRVLFTEIGELMGTPEYMSPEQAERTGLDVDTRTDVYSLGVLLYELLAGALPFDSKSLREGSLDDVRRRLREIDPPTPSTRVTTLRLSPEEAKRRSVPLSALSRQLRGDLDWIVMRAMEKDRTRRYASASELAADIVRHLNDEPVLAGPPGRRYRIEKFVRRHKVEVATGAAVSAALLLGLIGTVIGFVRARQAERIATEEAETARQISDFLVGMFQVADPESTLGNTITVREILDRGAVRIEHGLNDRPRLQARLLETMGQVYKSLGLYSASQPLLERSLATRRNLLGEIHPEVALSQTALGDLMRVAGNLSAAESLLTRALATQEKLLGPEHLTVASTLVDLGSVYVAQGKFKEAEPLLERSLAIRERLLPPEHPDLGRSLSELGILRWRQGKYADAEALLGRAITVWEKSRGPDHPDVARALNNLAIVLRNAGKPNAAVPLYQRALAIYEKALGPEHPRVATTLNNLGLVLYSQGDYAAAAPMFERALAIQEKVLSPDHPNLAATLNNLANLRKAQKNYPAARALLQRALAIREKSLGPDHPDVAWSIGDLGILMREQGDYAGAEVQFRTALATFERIGQQDGVAWTLNDMALLNQRRGDTATAESYFQRAIATFEANVSTSHPDLAEFLDNYAGLLRQSGRSAEAEPLAKRAAAIRSGQPAISS